jgi:hypothetical protein
VGDGRGAESPIKKKTFPSAQEHRRWVEQQPSSAAVPYDLEEAVKRKRGGEYFGTDSQPLGIRHQICHAENLMFWKKGRGPMEKIERKKHHEPLFPV